MIVYKISCSYRDIDGELYTESKTAETDSKPEAGIILRKYFYKKYNHLPKENFLFSTVKSIREDIYTVHATGAGSIAIGGNANGATINTSSNYTPNKYN